MPDPERINAHCRVRVHGLLPPSLLSGSANFCSSREYSIVTPTTWNDVLDRSAVYAFESCLQSLFHMTTLNHGYETSPWPRYLDECKLLDRCYLLCLRHSLPRPTKPSSTFNYLCMFQLLAVGWMDGQVSAWSVMETLQENASACTCSNQGVHKQPITVMLWNPSGTRLVTGDKASD